MSAGRDFWVPHPILSTTHLGYSSAFPANFRPSSSWVPGTKNILHTPFAYPLPATFLSLPATFLSTQHQRPTTLNNHTMATSATVHPAASSHISTTIGTIITIFKEKIADESFHDWVQYGRHRRLKRYSIPPTTIEDRLVLSVSKWGWLSNCYNFANICRTSMVLASNDRLWIILLNNDLFVTRRPLI